MADVEIIREQAEGYTHQGHSVSYTDAYIKVRRSFLNEALRTLKGAPLSVFFAVSLSPEPPDVDTICALTGYHSASVCKALDYLVTHHFLQEVGREGSRGVKVYVSLRYAWSGSDKRAPREGRISKSEIRRELFARHDDDELTNSPSTLQASIHDTQKTREIFAGHIQGVNLDRLAAGVSPETAQLWVEWLERVDRKRWTNPEGYCFKKLNADPEAHPPAIAVESAPRPRRPTITGKLANIIGSKEPDNA